MARGRPRSVEPTIDTHVYLPESLHSQISILLWSELEGKIPYGQLSSFLIQRAKEFFATKTLDVGKWTGQEEGIAVVRGDAETLKQLETKLKGMQT